MSSSTLGHYQIAGEIGAGGMGAVYRAHDQALDRDVAIKLLPADSFRDANARARLLREARIASQLNHPNICTIYEVGEADGQAYIAMELVEGQPLSTRLEAGALPVEEVLRLGLQLAEGWDTRMSATSCTAISRAPTSSSLRRAAPRCSISAWPSASAAKNSTTSPARNFP